MLGSVVIPPHAWPADQGLQGARIPKPLKRERGRTLLLEPHFHSHQRTSDVHSIASQRSPVCTQDSRIAEHLATCLTTALPCLSLKKVTVKSCQVQLAQRISSEGPATRDGRCCTNSASPRVSLLLLTSLAARVCVRACVCAFMCVCVHARCLLPTVYTT